jgi:hypothetical protein
VDNSVESLRETPTTLCTTSVDKSAIGGDLDFFLALDRGFIDALAVDQDVLEVALEGCRVR